MRKEWSNWMQCSKFYVPPTGWRKILVFWKCANGLKRHGCSQTRICHKIVKNCVVSNVLGGSENGKLLKTMVAQFWDSKWRRCRVLKTFYGSEMMTMTRETSNSNRIVLCILLILFLFVLECFLLSYGNTFSALTVWKCNVWKLQYFIVVIN